MSARASKLCERLSLEPHKGFKVARHGHTTNCAEPAHLLAGASRPIDHLHFGQAMVTVFPMAHLSPLYTQKFPPELVELGHVVSRARRFPCFALFTTSARPSLPGARSPTHHRTPHLPRGPPPLGQITLLAVSGAKELLLAKHQLEKSP